MSKIAHLIKLCQKQRVFAYIKLYQMSNSIHALTQEFDDDIGKYEKILQKKKHLSGKKIIYYPLHFPEVSFDNALASSLVELFEMYDHLICILKTLRTSGCFINDDEYFSTLRHYFKQVNRLLSSLLFSSVKTLPSIKLDEAIHQNEFFQHHKEAHEEIDYALLYRALTSNIAPRLEEKIRQPLLSFLKKRL